MNKNDLQTFLKFEQLYELLVDEQFVTDRTGVKMVELLYPIIELQPTTQPIDLGARKTPMNYVSAELNWYLSQSLNIEQIKEHATMWENIASKNGEINSNYGWMIFSKENGSQFDNCINELKNNRESRRAVMIYQRPSMWEDWNRDGMNDFVCTDGVQLFIRDNKLIYIIKQRSCDAIFGYFNDLAWHQYVYQMCFVELQKKYPDLQSGKVVYIPFSFHVYERHFDMLRNIYNGFYDIITNHITSLK